MSNYCVIIYGRIDPLLGKLTPWEKEIFNNKWEMKRGGTGYILPVERKDGAVSRTENLYSTAKYNNQLMYKEIASVEI